MGPKRPSKLTGGSAVLELYKERTHYVVKRNDLIQSTRYRLTANEQKLILHLIQEISPKTTNLTFRLDVHKYAKFLGVKDNRMNVHRIKRDLKKLNDKSFWLQVGGNGHPHEQLVSWFGMIDHDEDTDIFTLRFDDRLKPFLLKTKMFFTQYNYYYIMEMRSKYSIRLYEYFLSYLSMQNRRGFDYSLQDILHVLDLTRSKSYHHFYNLNKRVLKPAIAEINKYTNIHLRVRRLKHGRTTYGINVFITKKGKYELRQTDDMIQRKLEHSKKY